MVGLASLVGCFQDSQPSAMGGDDPTSDGGKSDSFGDSETDGSSGDSGEASTGATRDSDDTGPDETSDGSTGASEAVCGDGMLEGDELCEPELDPDCTQDCVPQGTRAWLTMLDDVLDDEGLRGQDLLVTADGSIAVAAHQLAFATDVQAVVHHLDEDGALTRTDELPGDNHDHLALAYVDGRHHVLAHDGADPWLAQLDGAGGMGWRSDWTHEESYQAHGVAADGETLYVFFLDAVFGSGLVPTLRAVDSSGQEQWDTTFAGHYVRPLIDATEGGVFVQYGVGEAEVSTRRSVCRLGSDGSDGGCWEFDLDAEIRDMLVTSDSVFVAGREVGESYSSWVVASFDHGGNERWRAAAFEDAENLDRHYAADLALLPDGRLVAGGAVSVGAAQVVGGWATFDSDDGSPLNTWTDDEVGAVTHVAASPDGTLVSTGTVAPSVFPKPVFVAKQLL